jgi:hypothetical protein
LRYLVSKNESRRIATKIAKLPKVLPTRRESDVSLTSRFHNVCVLRPDS